MQKILLKGRGIEHSYQEGKIKTPVLKGIDLDIEASKMTAIVGKSGSGKSTLLHILGTLDTPNKGEIFFQEVNITKLRAREKARFRNRHLGFVYQFHHLLGDFTALENVMLPLFIDKMDRALAYKRASYLLDCVGLENLKTHLPSELSGGERQRVAIARALVHSPELVLADEPTGNLDEKNANVIFELFRELVKEEGAAVVMVTHDQSLAQKCDHILEIVDGVIVNTAARLQESHQSMLYSERYNEDIIAVGGDSEEVKERLFTPPSWDSYHLTPNAAKALAKARAQEALALQAAAVVEQIAEAPATTIAKLGTDTIAKLGPEDEISAAAASTISSTATASLQHESAQSYRVESTRVTAQMQGAPELECHAVIFGQESDSPAYEAAAVAVATPHRELHDKALSQLNVADADAAGKDAAYADAADATDVAATAASHAPQGNAQQR